MTAATIGLRDRAAASLGTIRTKGAAALGSLLILAFCAPAADAAPLSMRFTEARADVGVQLSDAALLAAPDTAPLEAQIDPASGLITSGSLHVPRFSTHITEPIVADVTVDFDIGVVTGGFTAATGALTLRGEAGGTLTSYGETFNGEECTVSTTPTVLELSTAGEAAADGSPPPGTPFAAGLAGPGAIAGQWTDMHAAPVRAEDTDNVHFCENVEGRIGGRGGIWLEQEGVAVPPPAPQPSTTGEAPGPPPPACIVPKLRGKTLKRARAALRSAGCRLGKVRKPKRLRSRRHGALVVKRSFPGAGAMPANRKVHLKLRLRHRTIHHLRTHHRR